MQEELSPEYKAKLLRDVEEVQALIAKMGPDEGLPAAYYAKKEERPTDATTKILKAWLAFLDTLYHEGVNAEHTINNVELSKVFTLDQDSFRKLLNPLGMKISYSAQGRETFYNQARQLADRLLLAQETTLMNDKQQYDVYAHITPVDYHVVKTQGYAGSTPEYGSGYNTYEDNLRRGDIPDNT